MAILDEDVAVYHHIVILALLHRLIDTVPGTQVGPSEVAFHHAGIGWLVQYAKIYRDIRVRREGLLHIGILRLYAELRIFLIILTKHRRQNLAEALTQMLDITQEDTCIPIELAALNKDLGEITLRFLRKRLYGIDILFYHIAHLDITITRFWTGRLDCHRQETVVSCNKRQALQYILAESLFIEDGLIGRSIMMHASGFSMEMRWLAQAILGAVLR